MMIFVVDMWSDHCVPIRVVNDTFEKYRQYRYRYRLKKVSSIPIPILNLKSIADTDTLVYDFSTTGDIRRRINYR
jgi:hypothetical protein